MYLECTSHCTQSSTARYYYATTIDAVQCKFIYFLLYILKFDNSGTGCWSASHETPRLFPEIRTCMKFLAPYFVELCVQILESWKIYHQIRPRRSKITAFAIPTNNLIYFFNYFYTRFTPCSDKHVLSYVCYFCARSNALNAIKSMTSFICNYQFTLNRFNMSVPISFWHSAPFTCTDVLDGFFFMTHRQPKIVSYITLFSAPFRADGTKIRMRFRSSFLSVPAWLWLSKETNPIYLYQITWPPLHMQPYRLSVSICIILWRFHTKLLTKTALYYLWIRPYLPFSDKKQQMIR